ncbi:MAG: oligopeptide/dipeptide ABC transporter ATP-binding protein [Treponema sp.]
MKTFGRFLRTQPVATASVVIIFILYLVMIFAEFVAPYPATMSFSSDSFHPGNVRITPQGIAAQECRVLNPVSWKYARVKGRYHKISFFVHGSDYKLLGFIPCSRHLFGTSPDPATGELYPVFLLGADNLGRDLFSRIVYGSRISLTIGFVASALSLVLAILLGGLAGYYGGATDWTIMRLAEFFMLIPGLYLILFLRSMLNTSMDSGTAYMIITLILSLVGWPGSARTIRGMVHAVKREDFVMDAGLEGIPSTIIIFVHIIPQIASLLIVSVALSVPGFIMSETTLSYLGLGISDPAVSWGSLINRDITTLSNLRNYPWLLTPVWLLLIVTLAFNFFGDALRDYFDPYHAVFSTWKKKFSKAGGTDKKSPETAVADRGKPFLSVENLRVVFTVLRGVDRIQVHAVRGVSFTMAKGEVLGIVGESGSGKSVTTTAIPGLLPQNAQVDGHIWFEGTDLVSLGQEELRKYRGRKIGLIFQEPGRSFDPLQNIGSVFFETFRVSEPDIVKADAYGRAEKLLAEVGVPDPRGRLESYPHQFSGGQLQRIGIALALARGCELLIADEPTTALDVTIQAQIVSLLLRLQKERQLSVIFISHNIDLVAQISGRMIVMYGGMVMEEGTAEEIIHGARHPYTRALLAASPRFGSHYTEERMKSIPGKVTDPAHPEPGCPFAPRCGFAEDLCRTPGVVCPVVKKSRGMQ